MTRITSHLRHAARRRSRTALAVATLAGAATVATVAMSSAAFAPQPGQRIDMKVLLLANTAGDADITAWEANLKREGTPYDRINGSTTLSASMLADGDRAKYQGVIVAGANGTVVDGNPDGFSPAEWALLRTFEKKFAIRQLNVNAVPGPSLGLSFNNAATGYLDGLSSSLTPEGLTQFSNLVGSVPFQDTDPASIEIPGYGATPCNAADAACAAASYETLLRGSGGTFDNASLLGIAKMKDEREEMNATFSGNDSQLHSQILRHAMLSWVTGGVFIGRERSYLTVDVDDVFLPDDRWNAALNTTPEETAPGQQDLRMTADDVQRLISFQNTNNVKFNLLFNGAGVEDAGGPSSDALTAQLLASKSQFLWVNHTFSHMKLDTASQSQIQAEIEQNNQFAQTHALPGYNRAELVTGEHSGIGTSSPVAAANPSMAPALSALGVTSVGADNSREAGQRQLGSSALTLPRYPMNVFYNVATWADQLDEYDWLYLSKDAAPTGRGNCTNSATTTCVTTPVTQTQFIDREASAIVGHMIGNDPRPHYAHQTNIMAGSAEADPAPPAVSHRGDGILYAVIAEALNRYRSYFSVPFQQPSKVALTQELKRQIAWSNTSSSQVNGYIQDGKVSIVSTVSRDVPITGTTTGDVHGGQRSGWLALTSGTTSLELEETRNTVAPVIAGTHKVGSTLTATAGTFTGTPTPVITSRQWQRRTPANGGAAGPWTSIPGATNATYVVTAADEGRQLRFVSTAANRRATWGMGLSAPVTETTTPVTTTPGTTTPGTTAPPPGATPGPTAPSNTEPPVGTKPPVVKVPTKPPFTCSVKRGKLLSVSCVVRNTSGRLKTARVRVMRGKKVVGRASGKVRGGNRVPTVRIKPAARRQNHRIDITVKLANGKVRSMTGSLKL